MKKKSRFFWRILLRIFFSCFVFALIGGGTWYAWKKYLTHKMTVLSATVQQELLRAAELTTVKVLYSDLVTIQKEQLLGLAKSFRIIKYNGVARAGIAKIIETEVIIGKDRKSLRLKLPPVEVLGNDISKLEVFDEHSNIFAPIKSAELFEKIMTVKDKKLEELIANGLLTDAEKQTSILMTRIFQLVGFETVSITFKHNLP